MADIFSSMERKELSTPRGPLVYWVSHGASGPTLVFLHSLLSDHREFQAQAEHFMGQHPMILWDSPGHGQSRPWSVFTYTYGAMALEALLKQENCRDPLLIGQDHGGALAQAYLRNHNAVGVIFPGARPFGPQYYSPWERQRMLDTSWRCHCTPGLQQKLVQNRAASPEGRSFLQSLLSLYSRRELLRLLTVGYCSFQKENQALDLPCPGLILTGEQDSPGKNRAELWSQRTGLPHRVIPGAGHLISLDAPQALNGQIELFLKSDPH